MFSGVKNPTVAKNMRSLLQSETTVGLFLCFELTSVDFHTLLKSLLLCQVVKAKPIIKL